MNNIERAKMALEDKDSYLLKYFSDLAECFHMKLETHKTFEGRIATYELSQSLGDLLISNDQKNYLKRKIEKLNKQEHNGNPFTVVYKFLMSEEGLGVYLNSMSIEFGFPFVLPKSLNSKVFLRKLDEGINNSIIIIKDYMVEDPSFDDSGIGFEFPYSWIMEGLAEYDKEIEAKRLYLQNHPVSAEISDGDQKIRLWAAAAYEFLKRQKEQEENKENKGPYLQDSSFSYVVGGDGIEFEFPFSCIAGKLSKIQKEEDGGKNRKDKKHYITEKDIKTGIKKGLIAKERENFIKFPDFLDTICRTCLLLTDPAANLYKVNFLISEKTNDKDFPTDIKTFRFSFKCRKELVTRKEEQEIKGILDSMSDNIATYSYEIYKDKYRKLHLTNIYCDIDLATLRRQLKESPLL